MNLIWISFVKLFGLGILLLCGFDGACQQRMQLTQYMFNGIVINPAYAGGDEALSFTFVQRNQWSGIKNAPTTQTLAAHTPFKKKQFGLGVTIVNDRIGIHQNLNAATQYAYRLQTGRKSYLSMGLQAGVTNLQSDYASLSNGTNHDPRLNAQVFAQTFFEFGAGLYFKSERFHAGLSAPELIPQKFQLNDTLSIETSKSNWFFFSKYRFNRGHTVAWEPSMLIKYVYGLPVSYDVNLNMVYRDVLTTGVSYRKSESVDFILKMQVTSQLQLGYSYDHAFGAVSQLSNGSHELMVHYLFRYFKNNIASPR